MEESTTQFTSSSPFTAALKMKFKALLAVKFLQACRK
jgi:hypothetical protein